MVVEVEHSPQKFWTAVVDGVFGQLLSLRWDGSLDTVFQDVKKKKCYPQGYFDKQENTSREPPPKLKLDQEQIDKVIADRAQKSVESSESDLPLSFYNRGGISVDLFAPGIILGTIL